MVGLGGWVVGWLGDCGWGGGLVSGVGVVIRSERGEEAPGPTKPKAGRWDVH